MFHCLVSSKFSMTATVLSQGPTSPNVGDDPDGVWVNRQDPDTGEIIRVWEPVDSDEEAGVQPLTVECMVRGVIDGGIRVAGTTERFTPQGLYDNVDYAKMNFPADFVLTKRDRVTDIKNASGDTIWKEEEFDDRGTVFEVLGITPILDPFGMHVENLALLKRAEVQQYG